MRAREAESSNSLIHSSNAHNSQDQAKVKARSWEFIPGLPCEWQGLNYSSCYLLPLRVCSRRNWNWKLQSESEPRDSKKGCIGDFLSPYSTFPLADFSYIITLLQSSNNNYKSIFQIQSLLRGQISIIVMDIDGFKFVFSTK